MRKTAARALGKLGDNRGVPALIDALDDSNESVRGMPLAPLAKLGDNRGVRALIDSLGYGNQSVRQTAAHALGNLGDNRASCLDRRPQR